MAKIYWAIPCKEFEIIENTANINQIFYGLSSKSLPMRIDRFCIATAWDGYIGETFEMSLNFRSPYGELYGPPMKSENYKIINIPQFIAFELENPFFSEEGTYTFEIKLDDVIIYKNPISIKLIE